MGQAVDPGSELELLSATEVKDTPHALVHACKLDLECSGLPLQR